MDSVISPYLAAPIIAWLIAQFIKLGLSIKNNKHRNNYSILFKSGSMPSSHSSTIVALTTVIGVIDGITSALFGLAAVVGAIVIYDALNVRRAVGEQGTVLKRLLGEKSTFYRAKGHKPEDVLVGSVIGILVGLLTLSFL